MKGIKKIGITIVIIIITLVAIWELGNHAWRIRGFHETTNASIETVQVSEGKVHITGSHPAYGMIPKGFIGYHAKEEDGKLYVGYKFSGIFGFFDSPSFDITIPTKGEVKEVYTKTKGYEELVWNKEYGMSCNKIAGIFIKLEPADIYSIGISYGNQSGGMCNADASAIESGEMILMDTDICQIAKETNGPVAFTVKVKKEDGSLFASGNFEFVERIVL